MSSEQQKQQEWSWQWEHYVSSEDWLFRDWIAPNKFEDFQGKRVLDAGCGDGRLLRMFAPYASKVVGVDLNASHVAQERTAGLKNVEILTGDIATISFPEAFDAVSCIGVIHHTDNPDRTFANLAHLTKSGGKTIIWTYSHEGNFLNEFALEPLKSLLFLRLPKSVLRIISIVTTILLYIPVYTIYLLPLRFLPYFEYFSNFRKLPFQNNEQNVFDKLNAPVTNFITKDRITGWFSENGYRDVHISPYKGVSWRGSGTKT
jgi:SAM-dependent methyltransferase